MRQLLAAAAALTLAAPALAIDPPASAENGAPAFSISVTDIGTLLDNPATRAVLQKHLPEMLTNPQIAMARSMTLKQVQGFAADQITDDVLARIDADLAALSAAS